MARGTDRIFVLGEEALDGEAPGLDPATIDREGPDVEPDRDDRASRLARGHRSGRRLGVGVALIGCATLVWLLMRGESAPNPAVKRVALPVERPAVRTLSPPTAGPSRAIPPKHRPAATPPNGYRTSNRTNEAAEREPTNEQAPPSPPIDEPAPLVEPASSPAVSSPAQAVRGGSGARPEFGIER